MLTNYRDKNQEGVTTDFQRSSLISKEEYLNLKDLLYRKPGRRSKPDRPGAHDKSTPLWDYMTKNDAVKELAK